MNRSEKIILFTFLGVICLCICVFIAGGGYLLISKIIPAVENSTLPGLPTETESIETQIETTQESTIEPPSFSGDSGKTLEILKNTIIPSADLVTMAEKFEGKKNIPRSLSTAPMIYQLGDTLDFWTLNTDTNVNKKITAQLAYQTDGIYFWIEEGIEFNKRDLKKLVETFANKIYPTDQEFFGKEWIPGVDNDPHLYILYATDLGSNLAGYSSDTDTVLPEAHPYANGHEMFSINADVQTLTDPYTYGVLAHEFQHLIHSYHDANEEIWLNEGFSELATFLNGYDAGGFDVLFAYNPDIQLNEWPNDSDATDAHYGSGFLFTTYLLDRFGEETTKAVVANKQNGLESIDDVFKIEGIFDPLTGKTMTADQLFMDWTLANYLQDSSIEDGRFNYHNYKTVPNFTDTETISDCVMPEQNRDVSQYGADYIHFHCNGQLQLQFSGDSTVQVIPVNPKEGTHFVWSNKADASDMTMTRQFDFTETTGNIEFSYDMWHDLETDYDYVYLLSSLDGENWNTVNTPSCTTSNLSGNSYGCAYNDVTPTWKKETVDLSKFAGQKVWLRFEYITDAAVTGEGFVLDNLSIPQIGYSTGFETDDGGWEFQGFVRIENQIPQTFLVSTVRISSGITIVEQHQIKPGEVLNLDMNEGNDSIDFTLVVSGSARYTRQKAQYQFKVIEK